MLADARTADSDDAHLLIGPVAQLSAERLAVGELARIEAGDVAAEVIMLLGPGADVGQILTKAFRHNVVGVADEDGSVAQPWTALDLLDHLGVVVGGEERLVRAAVR